MKTNRIAALVMAASATLMTGYAQTAAEQMQKGIYTQETAGDLDGAIAVVLAFISSIGSDPDFQSFHFTTPLSSYGQESAAGYCCVIQCSVLWRDPGAPRYPLEIPVECADPLHPMRQCHSRMNGVPRRERPIFIHQCLCPVDNLTRDGNDMRKNIPRQRIDSAAIRPSPQRPVPMHHFLKNLGIQRGIDFAPRHPLEESNGGGLIRMLRAGSIHQNV